jgi:hypothetical protein
MSIAKPGPGKRDGSPEIIAFPLMMWLPASALRIVTARITDSAIFTKAAEAYPEENSAEKCSEVPPSCGEVRTPSARRNEGAAPPGPYGVQQGGERLHARWYSRTHAQLFKRTAINLGA